MVQLCYIWGTWCWRY